MKGFSLFSRLKFFIERQFIKGAHYQLLGVAALIGIISFLAGLLVHTSGNIPEDLGSSVWWAFLRLSDPGYLGDDTGTLRRIVSTFLTLAGYVVFLGALVAIMTRWLISKMTRLEEGLSHVSLKNHIVILGWGDRTVPLVRDLLHSETSVRRFLKLHDAGRLRIVVLVEKASSSLSALIKNESGIGRSAKKIVLRSGTMIQPDALMRTACAQAAAVIIPGDSCQVPSQISADVETIKALFSIDALAAAHNQEPPFVIIEVQNIRRIPVIRRAYKGPIEILPNDMFVSRLIAQNILHPGLSFIYNELLTANEGSEVYLSTDSTYTGKTIEELEILFPHALLCGIVRAQSREAMLNVPSNLLVNDQDSLVLIARSAEAFKPETPETDMDVFARTTQVNPPDYASKLKLLILGWNQRLPVLLEEIASYTSTNLSIDILSIMPAAKREETISRHNADFHKKFYQHYEADFVTEGELRKMHPEQYDTILLVSVDHLASGEQADARALVGSLLLNEILCDTEKKPRVLVELSDPDNQHIAENRGAEIIITPMIMGHFLAQIALRRELRLVFDALFSAQGAEILFRTWKDYHLKNNVSFREIQKAAAKQGETALGVFDMPLGSSGLFLNPPKNMVFSADSQTHIITLAAVQQEKKKHHT